MKKNLYSIQLPVLLLSLLGGLTHCTTPGDRGRPIASPFGDAPTSADTPVVMRSKNGDRSFEIELPQSAQGMDFVMPTTDANGNIIGAQGGGTIDQQYWEKKPGPTDGQITRKFPYNTKEEEWARQEIESDLGMEQVTELAPDSQKSYLATMDKVKQLFKTRRYEAAILELDQLLREYPENPKVYEMKGTVLDRLGHTDLAIEAWQESLKLNPTNIALKKFLERKNRMRGLASP